MKREQMKLRLVEKVVAIAKKKAQHSMGRSIPWGMYEVEVRKN